jgi:predicted DNA-binding ribbon-helix-helix protein
MRCGEMSKSIIPSVAPVSEARDPGHRAHNSPVIKRSIIRNGHKSSVSLEDEFWEGLREIAGREGVTVSALVGTIDHGPNRRNLSSAIRVFVLDHFRRNGAPSLPLSPHAQDVRATSTTAPQAS